MTTAWLMLAAGDDRQHAGNDGYDDDPSRYYSWDSTVANHARPQDHDQIVLWDKRVLLGASVIEDIKVGPATKVRRRCPTCSKTGFKERALMAPRFRCPDCEATFDEPIEETIDVTTYRSYHEPSWVDLNGRLEAAELRDLCIEPKSIQSLRELNWDRFRARISDVEQLHRALRVIDRATKPIVGGHRLVTTRARIGQDDFRRALVARFGNVCAVSGPQPRSVLEAAHLYSYADTGEHHDLGGFLLRRDIHRLFDLGLVAVDPSTLLIDVDPELHDYVTYRELHGRKLAVEAPAETTVWLKQHWELHRG